MSDIVIRAVTSASPVIKATVSASPVIKPSNAVGPQGPQGEPGSLTGPASSVDGNILVFNGTGGNEAKDSGVKPADFIPASTLSTLEPNLGNPASDGMVLSSLADGTRSWVEGGSTLTTDELAAINGAATPSSTNVFATMDDVGSTDFATTAEVSGVHTTGSITAADDEMTVASATGIVAGMMVVGEGIAPGTTVSTVDGTTVTLSANAGVTLSADPVGFYLPNVALSPGNTAGMLCKAWVNFNGTGTVAIRASFNVSSITDNGTGNYTVNFTTAMPDANYVPQGAHVGNWNEATTFLAINASWVRVQTQVTGGSATDSAGVYVAIFG